MTSGSNAFQSFWFGGALSPYEKTCLKSFIDHGHGFQLYSYSSELDVPDGVELKDASEILPQSEYFSLKAGAGKGSHSPFSNLFRYALLLRRGGWWVDMDVVCLSGAIPDFQDFFAYESEGLVNGAVLRFAPSDSFVRDCYHKAALIRDAASWGDLGPSLITEKLKESGRIAAALPAHICYPIHWANVLDLMRPSEQLRLSKSTRDSLFLHLWNEVFRRMNISKVMLPPRGSLMRNIVDRHCVEGWCGEYDADFFEHTLTTERQLGWLRKSSAAMREEVETLRTDCDGRRVEAELLRGESETLRGQVDTLRDEVGSLRAQAQTLQLEAEALRRKRIFLTERKLKSIAGAVAAHARAVAMGLRRLIGSTRRQ